jgi:hypothetical protein
MEYFGILLFFATIMWLVWPDTVTSTLSHQISDFVSARLSLDLFLPRLLFGKLARVFVALLLFYVFQCLSQSPPVKSKSKTKATQTVHDGGAFPCAEYVSILQPTSVFQIEG